MNISIYLYIATPLLLLNLLAGIPTGNTAYFVKLSKILYTCIAISLALTGLITLLPITSLLAAFLRLIHPALLTSTLILLAFVSLGRLLRGGNLLSLLFSVTMFRLCIILRPIGSLLMMLLPNLVKQTSNPLKETIPNHFHKHHINSEGEYVPHDEINYKF